MDKFEAIKDDRLHQSLSSGWASFLAAQQCSHEVSALRQAFNEEIHRLDRMYSSLQRDSVRQHDLIAAAVTESKSLIEQHASELKEIITIQNSLSTLKHKASQDKEYMLTKINELSKKVATQQESLEGIRSTTAQDISNAQGQYRSALEKLQFLQGELKELRAEKIASEQRLAALEHQIAAMAQAHRESPSETANLHDETLPLQDELMKLPDKVDCHVSSQASTQSTLGEFSQGWKPPVTIQEGSYCNKTQNEQLDKEVTKTKKKMEETTSETEPKRAMPSSDGEDIRALYLRFRDRYKRDPPRNDADYVWEFIGSIKDPSLSKHIQESLVVMLPDYVTRTRDTRRRNPQRHINISRAITWRKFREALAKIPPPA